MLTLDIYQTHILHCDLSYVQQVSTQHHAGRDCLSYNFWPLFSRFIVLFVIIITIIEYSVQTSAGLELTRTAGRIALTFFPILWIGRMREKRAIHFAAIHGIPVTEEKKQKHARNLLIKTRILQLLILVPVTLFWFTILVNLERTPLTGRSVCIIYLSELS
jgi:hypothetical protein